MTLNDLEGHFICYKRLFQYRGYVAFGCCYVIIIMTKMKDYELYCEATGG